ILEENKRAAAVRAANASWIENGTGTGNYKFMDFGNEKSAIAFRGSGALATFRNEATVLFQGKLPSDRYELSFWFTVKDQQTVSTQFAHGEKTAEGEVLKYEVVEVADLRTAFLDDWMLATYTFEPTSPDAEINIFLYRE